MASLCLVQEPPFGLLDRGQRRTTCSPGSLGQQSLSTGDALPPGKMLAITIKFLIDHHSTTSITPHIDLPGFRKANCVLRTAPFEPYIALAL